jgi:hypothetical protein
MYASKNNIYSSMISVGVVALIAALFMGGVMMLSTGKAHGAEATVKTTGGIPHVSGGIGDDSIAKLESQARDYNLKLVFALQSGNYVTDVKVVIGDAKGKTLLDATSAGPWFLAKLPAGNYQIVATFEGKAVKRSVTVGKAKLQTVDFRWAAE